MVTILESAKERKLITGADMHLVYELVGPREDAVTGDPFKALVATPNHDFWAQTREYVLIIWEDCKGLATGAEAKFIERLKKTPILEKARWKAREYIDPADVTPLMGQ
jgi:hypothetical protein